MDQVRMRGAKQAARIDQQVGDLIRKRRTMMGYTQEQLADALEISYQQIQKYETGANRVSAGRLFQIAQRLETPVSFFFEGLGVSFEEGAPAALANRATIELVRNFNQISDSHVRNAVTGLVKTLAGAQGGQSIADAAAAIAADVSRSEGSHRAGNGQNGHANGRNGGAQGRNGHSSDNEGDDHG